MALPFQESFAGSAAALSTAVWKDTSDGGNNRQLARDGSGNGIPNATRDCQSYDAVNTYSADQYAQIVPQFAGPGNGNTYTGLMVRASGASYATSLTCYLMQSDGGSDGGIYKIVNGAFTLVKQNNAFTFASGDLLRMEVSGTSPASIVVKKNGTTVAGWTCSDASSPLTSGAAGAYMFNTVAGAAKHHSFEGGNLGAATHATTGALTGPGSTVAGTAVHKTKHTTSGALTGPGSTVAGTAKRFRAHPSSGALTGAGSTVVGTAKRFRAHPTSGALTGPGSALAGTAKRFRAHGTSGTLSGVSSTIAGTAVHTAPGVHAASGTLIGAGSLLTGIAALTHIAIQQSSGGYLEPTGKRRTKEDIRADRIRFGVLQEPKAVEAVQQVAQAIIQARNTQLALQEQEQADLLRGTLLKQGIELKATPRIEAVLRTVLLEEMARQDKEDWAIVELMFNEL